MTVRRTHYKERISVTIENPVVDKLRDIRDADEYANFSIVTNKVLREGLKSLGYKIEA